MHVVLVQVLARTFINAGDVPLYIFTCVRIATRQLSSKRERTKRCVCVCEVLKRKNNRKPIDPVRGWEEEVVNEYLYFLAPVPTRDFIIIIIIRLRSVRYSACGGAPVQQAKRSRDVMEIENNRLNDRHSASKRFCYDIGQSYYNNAI